ncbi:hypothetical protein ACF0H5_000096 [Mactra antiquata]
MQYHALSLLKCGYSVDIVGYKGSELQSDLEDNDMTCVKFLYDVPSFIQGLPRLLGYVLKVIWQVISLGITLLLLPKSGHILIQNPPCIPTFLVVYLICWLRGSKMFVDWHNYGYTIMELSHGKKNVIVKFAKWYEQFFGKLSAKNICVTKSMQEDLKTNWGVGANVLYDRPPDIFKQTSLNDRHELFVRLGEKYPVFKPRNNDSTSDETIFTVSNGNDDVCYLQTRPALLISSTSWTEDEDFGVLLQALEDYEKLVSSKSKQLPDIFCVITGKGPLKQYYEDKINKLSWNHVSFCLPWLTPEDYPKLLGSADLGVCLHKSSSGLDLPMKVVDMFGCGLPVCAINFNCLNELVKHEENGLIFNNSEELTQNITTLLDGFPNQSGRLDQFRKNLTGFQSTRWHDCWTQIVLPMVENQTVSEDVKKSQ